MKYFYFVLSIIVLATSCNTSSKVGESTNLFKDDFGVQTYSFRNYFPKDMIGTLDRIQRMGITKVEGDGGKIPPEEFRRLCKERGISIPSTSAQFQELIDDPMAIVDKAKNLGADYVMCAWVPHEGVFELADADKAVAVFNKAGKVLAENGIIFTYHAHGYEFQPHGSGTLLDYIIMKTDPKYVSFEMDIFWMHFGGGDPVALMKKYGNRWKLMHMKDMKKGTPRNLSGGTDLENNVALGSGELDIPAIIREGNRIGIAHYFIEDESSSVISQVPASIAYLKSL
ncbi:MAG: sugar phosphate isomerase/epimerase [Saprospiraceae bacterium]|jgi:sugar phosphate isomerase/epimerase